MGSDPPVAQSSLGSAAYREYERVFGSRIVDRWPFHLVLDGLNTYRAASGLRQPDHPPTVRA